MEMKFLDGETNKAKDEMNKLLYKKEIFKSDAMSYLLAKKNQIYDLDNLKLTNSKNYYVQLNTDKNEKMVEMKLFD